MEQFSAYINTIGTFLIISAVVCIVLATIILLIAVRQVRDINVPEDADFVETLHYAPFLVVLGIDILDFGLDIFAAPIAWVVLDKMGLKGLRGVSAVEAFIPGTQIIPLLTLSWIAVRITGHGKPETKQLVDNSTP